MSSYADRTTLGRVDYLSFRWSDFGEMMDRFLLRDDQWERIKPPMPKRRGGLAEGRRGSTSLP
jgi:hypothetical protein